MWVWPRYRGLSLSKYPIERSIESREDDPLKRYRGQYDERSSPRERLEKNGNERSNDDGSYAGSAYSDPGRQGAPLVEIVADDDDGGHVQETETDSYKRPNERNGAFFILHINRCGCWTRQAGEVNCENCGNPRVSGDRRCQHRTRSVSISRLEESRALHMQMSRRPFQPVAIVFL